LCAKAKIWVRGKEAVLRLGGKKEGEHGGLTGRSGGGKNQQEVRRGSDLKRTFKGREEYAMDGRKKRVDRLDHLRSSEGGQSTDSRKRGDMSAFWKRAGVKGIVRLNGGCKKMATNKTLWVGGGVLRKKGP